MGTTARLTARRDPRERSPVTRRASAAGPLADPGREQGRRPGDSLGPAPEVSSGPWNAWSPTTSPSCSSTRRRNASSSTRLPRSTPWRPPPSWTRGPRRGGQRRPLGEGDQRRLVPALPKAPENPVLALIHGKADQVKPKRLVFDLGGSTACAARNAASATSPCTTSGISIVTTRKAQQFGAAGPGSRSSTRHAGSRFSAVREAFVGADAPDPHIAALAVLLRSVDADRKALQGPRPQALRRRVAEIVEGDWMRETLSEAVEDAAAAATAAALEQPARGRPRPSSGIPTRHRRAGSDPVTPCGPGGARST